MSSIVRTPVWAIVFPDGRIITGTDLEDEERAWTIALGWPHTSEIEHAKRLGVFATRAVIEYTKPNVDGQQKH